MRLGHDVLPMLSTQALKVLRQPVEDNLVALARASGTVTFPANVSLIAS